MGLFEDYIQKVENDPRLAEQLLGKEAAAMILEDYRRVPALEQRILELQEEIQQLREQPAVSHQTQADDPSTQLVSNNPSELEWEAKREELWRKFRRRLDREIKIALTIDQNKWLHYRLCGSLARRVLEEGLTEEGAATEFEQEASHRARPNRPRNQPPANQPQAGGDVTTDNDVDEITRAILGD